jgi:serine/threonine protein kinase
MPKKDKEWERFRVIKRLGAGSFGRTLLVADASKGDRHVVIKVPHDKKTEKALINDLINASALTASLVGLSHPNIVRCLGFDTFEGYYVMIMDYVQGKDLRQMIGPLQVPRRPMELDRAMKYFKNASAGLVEAHRINLLHRDIKPDNIIVQEADDIAKLLDFGISTIVQSSSVASGTVAGTFPYMAPEALAGRPCKQSDIWSLSVTLYELLTGTLPFFDENLFELKKKIDTEDPVEPQKLNADVDSKLNNLALKGLQKDPSNRYQSAQEMLDAFGPSLSVEIESLRQMFNDGKEAEAESRARAMLKDSPQEVALYLLIGEFCNRRQQYFLAEEVLRKGIAACPEHAGLHFYLAPALFYQSAKKKQQALAAMERAIELGLAGSQKTQAERLLRTWSRK